MNKILLLAYTNKNFGDDMFIKTISCALPEISFVIEAPKEYKSILKQCSNIKVKSHTFITKLISLLDRVINKFFKTDYRPLRHIWVKQYSAVVYVIGGLFDDDDLWERTIKGIGIDKYKDLLWKHSFYKDVPFYLLGCNMTRIKSNEYIEVMNYVFDGIRDICFRDRYSYNYFSNLPNTRYAPDIVFNYPTMSRKRRKNIVISVWGVLLNCDKMPQWKWAESMWHDYENLMYDVISFFKKINVEITLLSMCENEGDLSACKKLSGRFDATDLSIVNYDGNLDEIIELFESSEFVVGTRFHSVVLALNTSTPVYPIVYESKTLQLLNDIDFSDCYSDITRIDNTDITKIKNSYQKKYICDISEIKYSAKKQFSVLKKQFSEEISENE